MRSTRAASHIKPTGKTMFLFLRCVSHLRAKISLQFIICWAGCICYLFTFCFVCFVCFFFCIFILMIKIFSCTLLRLRHLSIFFETQCWKGIAISPKRILSEIFSKFSLPLQSLLIAIKCIGSIGQV